MKGPEPDDEDKPNMGGRTKFDPWNSGLSDQKTLAYMKRLAGSSAYHRAYGEAHRNGKSASTCSDQATAAAEIARNNTKLPWPDEKGDDVS